MANQCTKFEVSSLSRSRDILGRLNILNMSLTSPQIVCHPSGGTCNDQPLYQI